jgi:hypothetical protein
MNRPLTDGDRVEAFRLATTGFERAAERWQAAANRGLTDEQLAQMLSDEIGMFGCRRSVVGLNVEFQRTGLRGTWESTVRTTNPPIYQGDATVRMARVVYGIAEPGMRQLDLFAEPPG